jgi:hypothetical protein
MRKMLQCWAEMLRTKLTPTDKHRCSLRCNSAAGFVADGQKFQFPASCNEILSV